MFAKPASAKSMALQLMSCDIRWKNTSGWSLALVFEMETNRLTQRLLAEGWTKDQVPPGCKLWNEYHGGWEYDYRSRLNVTFETPCGLILKRTEVSHSGYMSYMGIDWTEENDNMTVLCPCYDKEHCELNHPLLEGTNARGGAHDEQLRFCAVHETDKQWTYEASVQRVRDLAEQEKDRLWEEFSARKGSRVCRHQCRYNRRTKKWTPAYRPEMCASYGCSYCVVLQKEIDRSNRGFVFYDEKWTLPIKEQGIFEAYDHVTVRKGKKLFDKPIPMTLCEAIIKYGLRDEISRLRLNKSSALFYNPTLKIEFINFRAEKKVGRDLLKDLKDVQDGISVIHEVDAQKEKAELKRQRKVKAAQQKISALERKILNQGLSSVPSYQRERYERILGVDRCYELDAQYKQKQEEQQLSLFEEGL